MQASELMNKKDFIMPIIIGVVIVTIGILIVQKQNAAISVPHNDISKPADGFLSAGETVINTEFTINDKEVISQSFGLKEQLQVSFNCNKSVLFNMYDDNGKTKLSTGNHPQTGWVRKTWTEVENYNFKFTVAEGEADCNFIVSVIGRLKKRR